MDKIFLTFELKMNTTRTKVAVFSKQKLIYPLKGIKQNK